MGLKLNYKVINCHFLTSGCRPQNLVNEGRQIILDCYMLCYVTKGKGKITVDGVDFAISEGQSFLTFPMSSVCLQPDSEDPWEYRWVEFRGLEAALLVRQTAFSKNRPIAEKIDVDNFESYFVFENIDEDTVYSQYRAGGKLMVLLSYYLEYFPGGKSEKTSYAVLARNYIEQNYRNPNFKVSSVANYIKIDRTYLYRIFKEELGMSVIDYINDCRVSKAEILLIDKNVSVKDVAYSVGFNDQMYFSRVFKKLRGITPSEFQKKNN